MDEKNDEGIIGTTKGYICYIQFSEKVLIPLVSKVDSGMETIRHVDYDSFNPKVFLTSCGDRTGKVRLYSSATVDSICEFSDVDLGPIAFITYAPKNRRQRLIGHQNGYVKIIDVEKLGTDAIYQVDLEEGEQLTCGSFGPCGKNLGIGTSYGSIYLCQMREPSAGGKPGARGFFVQRVDRVSATREHAVTSIAMTSFNPNGTLLAAFDNGNVKVWQCTVSQEKYNLLNVSRQSGTKKSKKAPQYSFGEIGECLFEMIDEFDMFYNPHGRGEYTEEEAEQDRKNYLVSLII